MATRDGAEGIGINPDRIKIPAGGELVIESGATLKVSSGANVSGIAAGEAGDGISLSESNEWTAPQSYKYDASNNGLFIIDTTDQTAHQGHWVFRLNDYYVSGDSGVTPGEPRMAINAGGRIHTMTDFIMSAHVIGSVSDFTRHPIAPFERTTSVDSLDGGASYVAAFYGDTDGSAMQLSCPTAESEAFLLAAGTRTPGNATATMTLAIDRDGAIFIGSAANPTVTAGKALLRPDKQAGMDPMLWRSASYTPTTGGLFTVVGDQTITKLGAPTGGAVSNQGTAGGTTYTYKVTAVSASGLESVASSNITTATGNATLSATNFNRISWNRIRGAAAYKVYRTVGGATQGFIGTISGNVENLRWDDDDDSEAGGETAPTTDATGNLTVAGLIKGDRVAFTAARAGITGDEYLNSHGVQFVNTPVVTGYRMHRAGSIIGLSMNARTTAFTANSAPDGVEVHKAGVAISSCSATFASAFSANDQARNVVTTFTRGVHTFNAGDTLSLFYQNGAGAHTVEAHVVLELVFDT